MEDKTLQISYILRMFVFSGGTFHLLRQCLAAGSDASAAAADHNFDVLLDALLYARLVYTLYTLYIYTLMRSVCF